MKKIVFKSRIEPILTHSGEVVRINIYKAFKAFCESKYKDSEFVKHYMLFSGQCGVYRFNIDGKPLYVGYSMNLKDRVRRSYFNHCLLRPKITFQYILADSQEQAMDIEAYYIKKLQPTMNIMGKQANRNITIDILQFTPPMKIYFNRYFKENAILSEGR